MRGDDAAGLRVAETVAKWQLPAVKSIATHQLAPELVNDLVETDYALFVDACKGDRRTRTVQLNPIVIGSRTPQALSSQAAPLNPLALLNLTQRLCGYSPQAWLLKVPADSFSGRKGLSSTTQKGCDRAVRTIEQFLRTYQQPAWMDLAVPA